MHLISNDIVRRNSFTYYYIFQYKLLSIIGELPPDLCNASNDTSDSIFDTTHYYCGKSEAITEEVFCSVMCQVHVVVKRTIEQLRAAKIEAKRLKAVEAQRLKDRRDADKYKQQAAKSKHNTSSSKPNTAAAANASAAAGAIATAVNETAAAERTDAQNQLQQKQAITAAVVTANATATASGNDHQQSMWASTTVKQRTPVVKKSTKPLFEVYLRGDFNRWDLEVIPAIHDFTTGFYKLQVNHLLTLAKIPSLLQHEQIAPYKEMCDGHMIEFAPPLAVPLLLHTNTTTTTNSNDIIVSNNNTGGVTTSATDTSATVAINSSDIDAADILSQYYTVWTEQLETLRYYNQVCSGACRAITLSHNAVYRMALNYKPFLTEYKELQQFDVQKDEKWSLLPLHVGGTCTTCDTAAVIADTIVGEAPYTFGLEQLACATSISNWLQLWYSAFILYEQRVHQLDTRCDQALLHVQAQALIDYLLQCPSKGIYELRCIGTPLLCSMCERLQALLVKCDTTLSDAPGDIDT
jgi:hypothetical protein